MVMRLTVYRLHRTMSRCPSSLHNGGRSHGKPWSDWDPMLIHGCAYAQFIDKL